MRFHPTRVHLVFLCFVLTSIAFVLGCTKDSDLLRDAVINDSIGTIEETSSEDGAENKTESRTASFSPTNDAHIQSGKGYNQHIIRLEESYRTSYLMFNLGPIDSIGGQITEATLQFTINKDDGSGTVNVSKGRSNDWSENDLSDSTAPEIDIQLGVLIKDYSIGSTEMVELSAADMLPETTTLILDHEKGNDLAFASKEHPSKIGPRLVVTYSVPEGSPEIEQEEEEGPLPKNGTQAQYYVTTSGKASNDGKSEAKAWSLEHAFYIARPGDIIYVKAGNYGKKELLSRNPGSSGSPIKFIGYKNTPGDVVSYQGSTFNYGESVNASEMPLLESSNGQGKAITLHHKFIEIENFQITGYSHGVGTIDRATNVVLKNIIVTKVGNQSSQSSYTGIGFVIEGNNTLLENCFVLNAGAEAIKLNDSDNSRINHCKVYADNPKNPTDYYFLLTGGTNNTTIENSYADRARNLSHGGHGFIMKDLAEYNTIRNCTAKKTSFVLNFSGVKNNTITNCKIYGVDTSPSNWHAVMVIFNGANNNLIKNMYIQDTWRAISWADNDDGYVGPGGDRDEVSMGYDNTFENITVKNTNRILNAGGGTNYSAKASRNTFVNCDFSDFDSVAVTYYPTEDILFKNCKFDNGNKLVVEAKGQYAPYSRFDVTWQNCTWSNVNFNPPN